MTSKTYMELVNEAIKEARVSLDPLTVLNFASPPNHEMYSNFKRWVNRAYEYTVLDRDEWQFRMERATITLFPRLQLRMSGVTALSVSDVIECDTSGVTFEILAIHSVEDVETDTALEYTVSVEYTQGNTFADKIVFNETFSRVSPSPASSIGNIKGRGRYSFRDVIPQIGDIDPNSFYIQKALQYNPTIGTGDLSPILKLTPDTSNMYWRDYYTDFNSASGRPLYIYELEDGNWDFYPRLNEPYDVNLSYAQKFQLLSAYDDIPFFIPADYHDMLMWKAVAEYADYDQKPAVYSRAIKNIRRFDAHITRKELPELILDLQRFDL